MHHEGDDMPQINQSKFARVAFGMMVSLPFIALLFVILYGHYWHTLYGNKQPWIEMGRFPLNDRGVSLVYFRQDADPLKPIYHRRLTMESNGAVMGVIELPLDTVGASIVNCYRHQVVLTDRREISILRLVDQTNSSYINLYPFTLIDKGKILKLGGGEYLGRFDELNGAMCFISAKKAPEQPINSSDTP